MVKAIVILSLFLLISIFFNGFLVWYVKETSSRLLFISENLSFLKDALEIYAKHIKAVYELETYYGDETIKHVFDHSRALIERISDFNDVIELSDQQEIFLDDREIEIEDPSTEKAPAAPTGAPQEKHVLYGGSRRSNR